MNESVTHRVPTDKLLAEEIHAKFYSNWQIAYSKCLGRAVCSYNTNVNLKLEFLCTFFLNQKSFTEVLSLCWESDLHGSVDFYMFVFKDSTHPHSHPHSLG